MLSFTCVQVMLLQWLVIMANLLTMLFFFFFSLTPSTLDTQHPWLCALLCHSQLNVGWNAGVRHIQAPLCGPSERRRRPRSLTFETLTPLGPMDRVRASPTPPGFDPVQADWLPIQIYESHEYRCRTGRDVAPSDGWQVHTGHAGTNCKQTLMSCEKVGS